MTNRISYLKQLSVNKPLLQLSDAQTAADEEAQYSYAGGIKTSMTMGGAH